MKPDTSAGSAEHDHQYHVRVVDRVVALLRELSSAPGNLGDVELSERLHLHKSTVHRLLAVLARSGLVERKQGSAKYGLGWRLFELGMAASSRLGMIDRAKPHVARLVAVTGETSHLGVLNQGEVVSLVSVENQDSVRKPATVGRRIPLHSTSLGKALLAFVPTHQVEESLKRHVFVPYTRNTITTRERFVAELALVAERGYAVDNEEYEEELRCIAAPVWDYSGSVVAALGIAGPRFRISGARLPALARSVLDAALRLSTAMGYSRPILK